MQGYTYMQVIGDKYPTVQASCQGDGSDYSSIYLESGDPIPSQTQLDSDIQSMNITMMWNAIKAERDYRAATGGYKVGTYWYHSDQVSRTQQIALVILGANIPANLQWKTMTGAFATMTQTLAGQIFGAAVQSDNTIFNMAQQHLTNMTASANPLSYDFSTGWPQTFQESQS